MNWRIGRYYLPEYEFWVLADQKSPPTVQHIRRNRYFEIRSGSAATVPVPKGGRVIWLLERNGPFHSALSEVQLLSGGTYILRTDIDDDARPFRVMDFEFVPK